MDFNYNEIFEFTRGEEGQVYADSPCILEGDSNANKMADLYGFERPSLLFSHEANGDEEFFHLVYDEASYEQHCPGSTSPFKELTVRIDGEDELAIPVCDGMPGVGVFDIDEEMLRRLCEARSLDFTVHYQTKGKSIAMECTAEEKALFADGLRAIYHYAVDRTMYADAVRRVQRYANERNARRVAEQESEAEQERAKGQKYLTGGIVLTVASVVMLLISFGDFDSLYGLTIFGFIALIVGVIIIAFGALVRKGHDGGEALEMIASKMKGMH